MTGSLRITHALQCTAASVGIVFAPTDSAADIGLDVYTGGRRRVNTAEVSPHGGSAARAAAIVGLLVPESLFDFCDAVFSTDQIKWLTCVDGHHTSRRDDYKNYSC